MIENRMVRDFGMPVAFVVRSVVIQRNRRNAESRWRFVGCWGGSDPSAWRGFDHEERERHCDQCLVCDGAEHGLHWVHLLGTCWVRSISKGLLSVRLKPA